MRLAEATILSSLARLVEVAAFQTKLKQSGYNPAKELNDLLIARMQQQQKL